MSKQQTESIEEPKGISINEFQQMENYPVDSTQVPDYPLAKIAPVLYDKEGTMLIRLVSRVELIRNYKKDFKQVFKTLYYTDCECTLKEYKEDKDLMIQRAIQEHLSRAYKYSLVTNLPEYTEVSAEDIEETSDGKILWWSTFRTQDVTNKL